MSNKKVSLLGAGGHAKVIIDMLRLNDIDDIIVFDDIASHPIMNIDIEGKIKDIKNHKETKVIIAIGNNEVRKKLSEMYDMDYDICVHPSAVVAKDVHVGDGTVITANATVNSGSVIGKHCIINTGAIIEHDNVIKDYVHISPGVKMGGNVTIGNKTWIGIGATIKNNIQICDDVIVGAGAIVVENIDTPGIYVGIPARVK